MKICNEVFNDSKHQEVSSYFADWPFELSDFQKWAIFAIHNNYDALVCAPTGSGKTLPSEFAIKYFVNKGKKIIYTTPIKALSNDKMDELSKKFPQFSFGILTGDNKQNPEADVLVMTTEIYLNTLKKMNFLQENPDEANKIQLDFNIDIQNELGCVVFDEVHYINDKDRGSVWEQSIMLTPKHIPWLGLSATIDNPNKICKWNEDKVGRKGIYLCETTHRNVPLFHYSFTTLPDSNIKNLDVKTQNMIDEVINKNILLKSKNEPFQEATYHKVKKVLKYFHDKKMRVNRKFVINKVIDHLDSQGLLPTLMFVFSKKGCYEYAKMVEKSLFKEGETYSSTVKKRATQILIDKLSNWKEYTSLPEFRNIIRLLEKGIAVHHASVTPIFREMIEILYRENYIRLLIATETFAVGINMGIKSVIFTSLTKHDGRGFRFLHSHEYGQASGRAGRRGKDDKGVIIHLNNLYDINDNNPDAPTYRKILCGAPNALKSRFNIDFKLILAILASGNSNIQEFINKSMLYNEINGQIGKLLDQQKDLDAQLTKREEGFKYLRTPIDVLRSLYEDKQRVNMMRGKKQKALLRKIANTEAEHKSFHDDYKKYLEYQDFIGFLETNKRSLRNSRSYVDDEISLHLQILEKYNFVEKVEDAFVLTQKGLMSSNIHEIHPLAVADLVDCRVLDELKPEEIVSVLSVFTPIRLSQDMAYVSVKNTRANDSIKNGVLTIKNFLDKYYDVETKYKTNFTDSYSIHYDMCDFTYDWCQAEDELACKKIYEEAKKYDIYVGDFVKAILKIVNICNEIEKCAIIQENVGLQHKLATVKDLVLKSIATNQSLYL